MDEILLKDTEEILGEGNLLVQTFDYSDEELSVQQFICKVLGLKLSDYNPTFSLMSESQDIANLFLTTNDAVVKLTELSYDFTAEESFMGLNSGFIDFSKGRFHRLINCRFHYVENDNLKTRIAKWIDFYPCKYKEEDIDADNYRQSFQCYLPEYNELWEKDLFYKPRKYLVIGRRADFSSDEWRRIKARYNNFEIYTYDDIVDTVVSFLYCV